MIVKNLQKLFLLILLKFFFIIFSTSYSNAEQNNIGSVSNYCLKNNKKILVVTIIPYKFPKEEKTRYAKQFEELLLMKHFEPKYGNKITFVTSKEDSLDSIPKMGCMPGCPTGGFWNQIFGSSNCNHTIMKKDKRNYMRKIAYEFKKQVVNSKEIVSDGVKDIFSALVEISNFKEKRQYDHLYIISSLRPDLKKDLNVKKLDEMFIHMIQEDKLPEKLPDAKYFGVIKNTKLINFWSNLYKNFNKKFVYD